MVLYGTLPFGMAVMGCGWDVDGSNNTISDFKLYTWDQDVAIWLCVFCFG